MPNIEYTGIVTSDIAVKSAEALLVWMLVSAAATGGAWQLNDSLADGGTDLMSGVAGANTQQFMRFGSPGDGALHFKTGLYADIQGTNVTITLGYI